MKALFGPPPLTPAEQAAEWKRKLQDEARNMDKQVRNIQREELKTKLLAKQAAKKGDIASVKLIAREMLRARQTVKRLHTTKAQLNSVAMQINMQMSQLKVTGALARSTHIMQHMNALCNMPQVHAIMQQMSREMTKAGLIEEMVNDTMDSALDDEISDSELDEEVNAVVKQIMEKQMRGTDVGNDALPDVAEDERVADDEERQEEEPEDDELAKKLARLTGAAAAASS